MNHVNIILECVGQGFSLPIDGVSMKSLIELYRRWLLEKQRPAPIEKDEQRIFRVC